MRAWSGLVLLSLFAIVLPVGAATMVIPISPAQFTAPEGITLEAPAEGMLRVVKGEKAPAASVVRISLATPVALPADADWFTVLLYPVRGADFAQGQRVTFVVKNAQGEELKAKSLPYVQNFWGQMGWQNLLSEYTLNNQPKEKRQGLQLIAVELDFGKGCREFWLANPTLFHGDPFSIPLVATFTGPRMNFYDSMPYIFPFKYREGEYECALTLTDRFQGKSIYETARWFSTGEQKGDKQNPLKAWDHFTLPSLPAGTYPGVLRYRAKNGGLLASFDVVVQVLDSQIKTLPAFPDHAPGSAQYVRFTPSAANFIFDATRPLTGTLSVDGVFSRPFAKPTDQYALTWTLKDPDNTTLASGKWEGITQPGSQALSIPLAPLQIRQNTACTLTLELLRGTTRLDTTTMKIGVRVAETYTPPVGPVKTWQEWLKPGAPLLGEGLHPAHRFTSAGMDFYINDIKQKGYVALVDLNGMWGDEFEPMPGFYTFGELDYQLDALAKNGLHGIIHTGGLFYNSPAWYQPRPARTHDGRYTDIANVLDPERQQYILTNIRRLAERYRRHPGLGMWMAWGPNHEGFYWDWWAGWQFGGGVTEYSSQTRQRYAAWLQTKYPTLAKLNAAYGTQYTKWAQVPVPMPTIGGPPAYSPLKNARPAPNKPYEDFAAFKVAQEQDFYENKVAAMLRSVDPARPIALYHYAETTPGFFTRVPGIVLRNGGNEGWFYQDRIRQWISYLDGAAALMSEDVGVWGEPVEDWHADVFNGCLLGRTGAHFFNYALAEPNKPKIQMMPHYQDIEAFFQSLKASALPVLGQSAPLPIDVGVLYGEQSTQGRPAAGLFSERYYPMMFKSRHFDQVKSGLKVIYLDSGTAIMPARTAAGLKAWVAAGGVLVMTPATGRWNADLPLDKQSDDGNYLLDVLGLPLPSGGSWGEGAWGQNFAESVPGNGIFSDPDGKSLLANDRDKAAGNGGNFRFYFHGGKTSYVFPKDSYPQATVLARYHQRTGVGGSPAIFSFAVGKGKVFLWAAYPENDEGSGLYTQSLSSLGLTKYVSFAPSESRADDYAGWMRAYALAGPEQSRLLMLFRADPKRYPHNTWTRETPEVASRTVYTFHLTPGRYEVFDMLEHNKSLGTFTDQQLATDGITLNFGFGDLHILQVKPVK
ncbi:MAG TPA: beta-galactosidase [Armatimonadota bacterium]